MARKPLNLRRSLLLLRHQFNRLVGRERAADILYVRLLEGWLSRSEIALLYDTVGAADGPGAIAEVGSWKGKSTVAIGLAVRRAGRDDTVYAIDHHMGSIKHQEIISAEGSTWPAFLDTIHAADLDQTVKPLKMDSVEAAALLASQGAKLKVFFLDGEHDEESVARDLEAYTPLLLPGAFVAMDDARPDGKTPGVWRAYERVLRPRAQELAWGGSLLLAQLAR